MFFKTLLSISCLAFALADKWTDLRITWGPNPFSSHSFVRQPRTKSDVVSNSKYEFVDSTCNAGKCQGGGLLCGERWQLKGDPAVRLVYGPNGFIVGIQASVLKTQYTPGSSALKMAIDEGNYWTLAAYFVDPTTVCQGRTAADFQDYGTGHGLWIQQTNGPAKQIPITQDSMTNGAQNGKPWWVKGKCFVTMGVHYWFNTSVEMPCDETVPMFVLYNDGKLDAFGWAIATGDSPMTSPRYEHPTVSILQKTVINGLPQCMNTDPAYKNLNSLHIYFNSNWNFC